MSYFGFLVPYAHYMKPRPTPAFISRRISQISSANFFIICTVAPFTHGTWANLQQPFTAYRAADVPVIWIVAYLVQSASFCLPFLGWVSAQVSIREGQSVDLNHRRTKIIRFMCTIHALFWSFTRSVYYFTSHVHDWNISLVYDCHISPYKTTLKSSSQLGQIS